MGLFTDDKQAIDRLTSVLEQLVNDIKTERELTHGRLDVLEGSESLRKAKWVALETEVTDLFDKISKQMSKLRQRDKREERKADTLHPGAPLEEPSEFEEALDPAGQSKLALYRKAGL